MMEFGYCGSGKKNAENYYISNSFTGYDFQSLIQNKLVLCPYLYGLHHTSFLVKFASQYVKVSLLYKQVKYIALTYSLAI